MKKNSGTKRALFTSVIALLLCMSMLVGTTFAWFTDEVVSGNNTIIAGNLDVELEYASAPDGTYTSVEGKGDLFVAPTGTTKGYWEPGHTEVAYLKVTNKGTLHLQYNLAVSPFSEVVGKSVLKDAAGNELEIKLSEILKFAATDPSETAPAAFTRETAQEAAAQSGVKLSEYQKIDVSLAPGKSHYIALVVYMPESVGNEANYRGDAVPTINFGVTLLATQEVEEYDSFGKDYDDQATYPKKVDTWDGTADTSWYNDTDAEFTLTTAEALAGLAELVDGGNNFAGKTIKLDINLDLYHLADGATDPTCFDPIGSYRKDKIFEGTFDGQDHTILNMSQNTWALDNGYAYDDLGLGLFGAVENATIKNLVMDKASISGESALCGTIAAVAGDNVTFENITVKNSNVADYQYYAGGIVGWAGGDEQFINCTIDASTTIAGQWGDFNNANGGVIGGVDTSAAILMKDCTVACRIDSANDVVSAYHWYSYRRSGMLIGDSGQKDDPDGDNVGNAIAPNLTCENVTVIYGDWANYHYCKFNAMGYPWVRVEAGVSVDAYTNIRYGHPTDANGNEVVDENHVHNDGEAHNELIVFDQLYGGATGDRYCTYGTATHDGVTVIYNNK